MLPLFAFLQNSTAEQNSKSYDLDRSCDEPTPQVASSFILGNVPTYFSLQMHILLQGKPSVHMHHVCARVLVRTRTVILASAQRFPNDLLPI